MATHLVPYKQPPPTPLSTSRSCSTAAKGIFLEYASERVMMTASRAISLLTFPFGHQQVFLPPHVLERLHWVLSPPSLDSAPPGTWAEIPAPHVGWSWRVSVTCPLLLSNVTSLSSLCPSVNQPNWLLCCSKPTSGPLHLLFPGSGVLFAQISTWLLPSAPSGDGPNVRKVFPDIDAENSNFGTLIFKIPWTRSLVGYSPWNGKELDMTE